MGEKPIAITITPGTVLTIVLVLAAVGAVFYLRETILVVFTAIVIASAIEPIIVFGEKYRIPRVAVVIVTYTLLLSLLITIVYVIVPPFLAETTSFIEQLPNVIESVTGEQTPLLTQEAIAPSVLESLRSLQQVFSTSVSGVVATATTVFGGILSFVFIFVLSFYFAVQDRGIDDFLRLVTPGKNYPYVLGLWKRSQVKIGRWLQGQIFISFIMAVLVFVGMLVLGVRYPLLLAITAGVLEVIPVFGSIIAIIPAFVLAFADGGLSFAIVVIAYYVVLNQFQTHVVYPLVVQQIVGVPPLLVILSVVIGGQLAGFWGVLLAVPVAAVLRELVLDFERGKNNGAAPRREHPPQSSTAFPSS